MQTKFPTRDSKLPVWQRRLRLPIPTRQPDQLFWYRASKAALNSVMRSLTTELEDDGVTVLLFHPGGVRTERLAALGSSSTLAPEESIGDMIAVIDRITIADTGTFLSHDGEEMPW